MVYSSGTGEHKQHDCLGVRRKSLLLTKKLMFRSWKRLSRIVVVKVKV